MNQESRSDAALSQKVQVAVTMPGHEEGCYTAIGVEQPSDEKKGFTELENALRLATEKNRNFLERLKELTRINRNTSDENKTFVQENGCLKSELAVTVAAMEEWKVEVNKCRSDKATIAVLKKEIDDLHEKIKQNDFKISVMTTACEEKDRRIELLSHIRRKRCSSKISQKDGGCWKDSCHGNIESDSASFDSETSGSPPSSVGMMYDEPTTLSLDDLMSLEEYQDKYHRLMKEHLTLEKSYSKVQLLFSRMEDESRGYKNKITLLTDSLNILKEKLLQAEDRAEKLQIKLEEVQAENEQLEFQILEAEIQGEENGVSGETQSNLEQNPQDSVQFLQGLKEKILYLENLEERLLEQFEKFQKLDKYMHRLPENLESHTGGREMTVGTMNPVGRLDLLLEDEMSGKLQLDEDGQSEEVESAERPTVVGTMTRNERSECSKKAVASIMERQSKYKADKIEMHLKHMVEWTDDFHRRNDLENKAKSSLYGEQLETNTSSASDEVISSKLEMEFEESIGQEASFSCRSTQVASSFSSLPSIDSTGVQELDEKYAELSLMKMRPSSDSGTSKAHKLGEATSFDHLKQAADHDFIENSSSFEESLWAKVENHETLANSGSAKTLAFWSDIEQRMGCNVDDITLVVEFEDSFSSGIDDSDVLLSLIDSQKSEGHSEATSSPPPLPPSSPPPHIMHEPSESDFASYLSVSPQRAASDIDDHAQIKDAKNQVRALDVIDKGLSDRKRSSEPDLESQQQDDTTWNRRKYPVENEEINKLKQQILELEELLITAQNECISVIQSKDKLKSEFEQVNEMLKRKEKEIRLLETELELLRIQRHFQDQCTQTTLDRSSKNSATQTMEDKSLTLLERSLELREKELKAKSNEADRLNQEMRDWQQKLVIATEEKAKMAKLLEDVQQELKNSCEKELQARAIAEEGVEKATKFLEEKSKLEASLASLQMELREKEALIHERHLLEQKATELEHDLKLKVEAEGNLLREIASLRHNIDDLCSEAELLREKKQEFEKMQRKYEDLGELTKRLQTAVSPMKARIARLAHKCKTKDELIQKVLHDLRHEGNITSLITEVEHEMQRSGVDDYTRPLSPLTISHLDRLEHEILKLNLASSNDEFLLSRVPPDLYDISLEAHGVGLQKQQDFTVSINRFQNSSHENSTAAILRTNHDISDKLPNHIPMLSRRPVTLLDTNFDSVDSSGRLNIGHTATELKHSNFRPSSLLNTAEDEVGYSFDAKNSCPVKLPTDRSISPDSILQDDFQKIMGFHHASLSALVPDSSLKNDKNIDHFTKRKEQAIPEPPSNFHVEKIMRNKSVLLCWTPPVMDDLACSCGSVVAGYKLFVNGNESLFLSSPHSTRGLLKALDFSKLPIRLTIRTISENGVTSSPAESFLDKTSLKTFLNHRVESSAINEELPSSSAASSPSHHNSGRSQRKMFLAIYDYSPSDLPRNEAQELGFQTGDIIVTYGPIRPDGYYIGKVRGRRGLVPGSFIEELAPFTAQDVKNLSRRGGRQTALGISAHNIQLGGRRSQSVGTGLNLYGTRNSSGANLVLALH